MTLNLEQIKSVTQGAEVIEQENGIVKFYRFTKDEQAIYAKTVFYQKTFATAGVQMEFETDGKVLAFSVITQSATSRTFFSADVFVDEKPVAHCANFTTKEIQGDYTGKLFPLGECTFNVDLGEGNKRIKIIFPWSVCMHLKEMNLKHASYILPIKKSKTMFVYGDSITNGYDAKYTSNAYVTQVASAFDLEIYNKAIGGEVFFPALSKAKSNRSPDYVLVSYGSNDWAFSVQEDFVFRCKEFFKNLTENYPNALIFVIAPIWRADFQSERKFGAFYDVEKRLREICGQYENVKLISGWAFVPQDINLFSDLRLHPNDDGFQYYAENLIKEMKNYIK